MQNDEDNDQIIEKMLHEAQDMFNINQGMPPCIFMKMSDSNTMKLKFFSMETKQQKIKIVQYLMKLIEKEKLVDYILMFETICKSKQPCLVVVHANKKYETHYICDVKEGKNGLFSFSDWKVYDASNIFGKKDSISNLFGRVFCKFN